MGSEPSVKKEVEEVFENFQDTSSFDDNRTDNVCSVPASQETRGTGSVADESRRRDCGVQSRSSKGVTPTQPLPVQCILEDIDDTNGTKTLTVGPSPNPPMIREIPLPVKSQHEYKMYEIVVEGRRLYRCDVCSATVQFLCDLKKHLHGHRGEKAYQCTVCEKKFAQRSGINTHLLVHTGERPFACPECPYSFNVKSNLNKHIERHSKIEDGPFACDDCGKVFVNKKSLVNHMRHHLGEASLWCRECGKYFTYKKVYTRHVFTVHTMKKTNNRRKKPRR